MLTNWKDAAVVLRPDRLHEGRVGQWTLRGAFQPVYETSGEFSLYGVEGLVRPYLRNSIVAAGDFLSSLEGSERLAVEHVCRALHIRNWRLAGASCARLFINVDPACYRDADTAMTELALMLEEALRYGL
jgi:EAL domain-containing protein (putative c-di-GMP-specific phosphodiesterase class I)